MNALSIIAELRRNNVVPRIVGDQLKLVGDTRRLSEEFIREVRENKLALTDLLRHSMEQAEYDPIVPVAWQADYPASNSQERIWVLSQFLGGNAAYNIIRSFYLQGQVDIRQLEEAFRLVIRRHESLRTVFRELDGYVRQVIREEMPFQLDFVDITGRPDQRDYLKNEIRTAARREFDLQQGPLIDVRLFRLSADDFGMIFCIHHIISDGWSIGVLVKEVMQAYKILCEGGRWEPVPLKIHYKDYSDWFMGRMTAGKGEQARRFWLEKFSQMPSPLNLPTDFARPGIRTYEGAVYRWYPKHGLYAGIQQFCRERHVTPFNFLRSALTWLLSGLSGERRVTIGTPVSGRNHFDLQDQIGIYVNTLPLAAAIVPDESFADLLRRVSDDSFSAFEHQEYPFDRIIDDLSLTRDTSRNPLFDVMMVLQDNPGGEQNGMHRQYGFTMGLMDKYLYPSGRDEDDFIAAKLDLTFNFDHEPDKTFYLELEYDTRLFTRRRVAGFCWLFWRIVEQVILNPAVRFRELEWVDAGERAIILEEYNRPVGVVEDRSLPGLLAGPMR
ncbi:MAG TPA: condensation domain-containing protein, partial [Puia sp.]|nr:condensation domain-containing protein [Puia sp.]